MRAHQIMTKYVTTVTPHTSIEDAANIMLRCHLSGVPVVNDDGSLVGIVSESDFLRRSEIGTERKRSPLLRFFAGAGKLAAEFVHERGRKIEDVMTRDPVTVNEQAPLSELVELMEKHGIKRVPVMSGKVLVGIMSPVQIYCKPLPASRTKFRTQRPTTITFAGASSIPWKRTIGVRCGSVSSCATASCISAVLLPRSVQGRRPSSARRTSRASKRCTTTCAGSNRCREFIWNRQKMLRWRRPVDLRPAPPLKPQDKEIAVPRCERVLVCTS